MWWASWPFPHDGTQWLTVNHRIVTPPSFHKSRFYCVRPSFFSDLARICSDTTFRDSQYKSGHPGNVSVSNIRHFIGLINSLAVSRCLFLCSLTAAQASPKVIWSTLSLYLVSYLVSCHNHPESEWAKVVVSMLSIDCRALFKYTFYGWLAKTYPDILLLRVQALYSKGEALQWLVSPMILTEKQKSG